MSKAQKSKKLAKLKKPKLAKTINKAFGTDFFTFGAKTAFLYLSMTFIKISIFDYFYPKSHIQIKTDVLRYSISKIICKLILDWNFFGYIIVENPNSSKSG